MEFFKKLLLFAGIIILPLIITKIAIGTVAHKISCMRLRNKCRKEISDAQ